jgi:dihydrofolate synthase/folylpolyglutamate synthase
MYQRVGAPAYKKGLGNTRALLKAVGNPHRGLPCIHIAGTNGKGTVAHMLASCLTAAGFKTGLYVSPHYKDFRERMKIDGKLIPKMDVVAIVDQMRPAIESVKPSFFEMNVAMAFRAFAHQGVEIAVIETGLGGRLDSTNVIKPLLSVITNISFDHMSMLGNTLPKIAREKAGIIKLNVPVVIGSYQRSVAPVFKRVAARRNAPISFASKQVKVMLKRETWESQAYDVHFRNGDTGMEDLRIGCAGPFQRDNLCTVLQALRVLGQVNDRYHISDQHVRRGLKDIRTLSGYQGRWQILGKRPLIMCDSAHNEAGLAVTLGKLNARTFRSRHFVLGFVNDKDLDGVLSQFSRNGIYYFCRPDIPRGLGAMELSAIAELYGLKGKYYSSVRNALAAATRAAHVNDLIFVGGSTFVVAEVL